MTFVRFVYVIRELSVHFIKISKITGADPGFYFFFWGGGGAQTIMRAQTHIMSAIEVRSHLRMSILYNLVETRYNEI